MRSLTFASAAILASLLSAPAFAQSAEDAAYDKHKKPVIDSQGDCVRTKWQDANDPCDAAPAPEPAPVAAPAPAAEPLPVVSLEQRTIYFDFDSAALTAESVAKLDALSEIINASSSVADVRIHGFTDQFGSSDYNLALASKRAAAVKAYLDQNSRIASTVAEVKGLGKSAPEAECEAIKARNERISCMAKERRVELELKASK